MRKNNLNSMNKIFPYSKDNPNPKECKLSGQGYVHCTDTVRKRSKKLCDKCSQNPDNIVLDEFLLDEKKGLDLFE